MNRTQRNRLSRLRNREALARRQDAIVDAQPRIKHHNDKRDLIAYIRFLGVPESVIRS